MPRLPRISGAEAIRALERLGFVQRGSHVVLKRVGSDRVTDCVVPLHASLAIGTLRGILKQAGVTASEFTQSL
jgi:predicted RNA binding protein YcfA (HicA-like mRNA interferase family)